MANMITPEQIAANGSEHSSQTALFCWSASSGISELRWLFAIPNGGLRDSRTAGKLKAEGVKAGVWDIFLPVPITKWEGVSCGLFLEMKTEEYRNKKDGGLRPEQKEFLDFVADQGYTTAVCYNWQEARDCILEYLGKK